MVVEIVVTEASRQDQRHKEASKRAGKSKTGIIGVGKAQY